MLEPYQPAYNAAPTSGSAARTAVTTSALPSHLAAVNGTGGNFPNEPEFGRKKRTDSLTSFRDNFREGYKNSHWNWKSSSSPKPPTMVGSTRPTSGDNQKRSVGFGGLSSSTWKEQNYRRGSTTSAAGGLGFTCLDYDLPITRRNSIVESRRNSISCSNSQMHQYYQLPSSNRQNNFQLIKKSHHRLPTFDLMDCDDVDSDGRITRVAPKTCITITNIDGDVDEKPHYSYEDALNDDLNTSNPNLREKRSKRYTHGSRRNISSTQESTLCGLKPLASNMRVRSAVDLVSLVMQEQRNFI